MFFVIDIFFEDEPKLIVMVLVYHQNINYGLSITMFSRNHDLVHVCTRTLYKWYFKRGYQRKKRKGCYFKDYKKVDWVILHVYAYNEFNFFLTWTQIVKNNLNAPLFS